MAMVEIVQDLVLGQCRIWPIYREGAIRSSLYFLAVGVAGWVILLAWLVFPSMMKDPLFVLAGAVMAVLGSLFVRSQVLTLSRPYFLKAGDNGFSVLGSNPILWKDVADIRVRRPGGSFKVVLARPMSLSIPPSMNAGLFMLGWLRPTQEFTPPVAFSPVSIETLYGIFLEHLEVPRVGTPTR